MLYKKTNSFFVKLRWQQYALLISYVLSFIILVIFFGIRLKLVFLEKDKEYYCILYGTKQIYLENIQNEFTKILQILEIIHKKPYSIDFLRSNLSLNYIRILNLLEHNQKSFNLDATFNRVGITLGFYTVQVDVQSLKNVLLRNISNNIDFKIYINDQLIVDNGEISDIFIKNSETLPLSSIMTSILSINKDYLLQEKSTIIRHQILEFIMIVIPIIIINIILSKVYLYSVTKKLKTVAQSYFNLFEEQNMLLQQIKVKNQCNEFLITKIKQKIQKVALEEKDIFRSILYFPLLIEEDQNVTIDSVMFFEDLVSFFQYSINKKKVDFQYSVTSNIFAVHLSRESFYQLIFSLFHNILYLLSKKSSLAIKFEVKNNRLFKIIIKYTGFQLTKEQIRSYTDNQGRGEIFLLNMNKTLNGLEKLNINWDIKNRDDGSIIQLNFKDIKQSERFYKEKNNIINLRDYYSK
jgi:hypothetical protein